VHTLLRYPPSLGGVETYAHELVERTRDIEAQRDVRVLTSKLRTHRPRTDLDPELLLDDPPYVQRLHTADVPGVSYPRLQALNYYLGHHQPNLIHGYGFWYQPADVAARYARRRKIPFIFHPMYYEDGNRRKLTWQLYARTIGRRTFATADAVVVISPFEQSLIERAGFPVKRFVLIPPGIDHGALAHPQANPFITRGINGIILLVVGRLAAGKGLADPLSALPELVKKHPGVQLVYVGEDFGEEAMLKERARELGLEKHVHFVGKLNREELIGVYQHATLLVHPSHYEAFGIVVAEAQAAGLPIVARNTSALPYVMQDGVSGRLFNDQKELVNAITNVLANPQLRQQFGAAGKKHVQQFSWATARDTILKLYDELA
jgi:glycosyltransferase involved in cell wall biosynthesis